MKKRKRIIASLLAVLMLFCNAQYIHAEECIEDGAINSVLEQYFYMRAECFEAEKNSTGHATKEASVMLVSPKMEEELTQRRTDLKKLKELLDVTYVDVNVTYQIENIVTENDSVFVEIYEYNNVKYRCNGFEDCDQMGFGSTHRLKLECNKEKTIIEFDSYSEENTTGFHSSDVSIAFNDVIQDETVSETAEPNVVLAYTTYSGYSPSSVIAYADRWCGTTSSGTSQVRICV